MLLLLGVQSVVQSFIGLEAAHHKTDSAKPKTILLLVGVGGAHNCFKKKTKVHIWMFWTMSDQKTLQSVGRVCTSNLICHNLEDLLKDSQVM